MEPGPAPSPSPRAVLARSLVALSLALGTFASSLAWSGAGALVASDGAVVRCAALSVALVVTLARCASSTRAALVATASSLVVGALVGLGVVDASWAHPRGGVVLGGAVIWVLVAGVRVLAAWPLVRRLPRGASLDAHDATDDALLAAALWLTASLVEMTAVLHAMPRHFEGMAGPALGVSMASTLFLALLLPVAVFARAARSTLRWNRLLAHSAHRLVDARTWTQPVPSPPWFHLTPLDGVLVRRMAREGAAYREGDVEMALTRVPLDPSRVRRMLLGRIAAAAVLFGLTLLTAGYATALRW